jgi:hypothetical protein
MVEGISMKRRIFGRASFVAALLFLAGSGIAQTEAGHTLEEERLRQHVSGTIASLEETVRELQTSPNNFGGRRVAALASSRQAVRDLKRILEYGNEDR